MLQGNIRTNHYILQIVLGQLKTSQIDITAYIDLFQQISAKLNLSQKRTHSQVDLPYFVVVQIQLQQISMPRQINSTDALNSQSQFSRYELVNSLICVFTNVIALYFEGKRTKLFNPFPNVCDEGSVDDSADVVSRLEPSDMNGNDSIIDGHRTSTLSRKSAYSVANFEAGRIDEHDSILPSETILVQLSLHSFLVKRIIILKATRKAIHAQFLVFALQKTHLARKGQWKILSEIERLLELHYRVIKRKTLINCFCLELLRKSP